MIETRREANAFTAGGLLNSQQTIESFNGDAQIRAIVTFSHGPQFFSAGADRNRRSTQ